MFHLFTITSKPKQKDKMKMFICCRSTDIVEAEDVKKELTRISHEALTILEEKTHSPNWKNVVEEKMRDADFVLFFLGVDTFRSPQLIWEYARAKSLNKRIIGYKLNGASEESILYCQGFQLFSTVENCYKYVVQIFKEDRELKLEQYKMMFESTQNVTAQRLTVNNLFFTLTASIFSIAAIVGKAFEFSLAGTIGMIILTGLALVVTRFWEKLIDSYGCLNKGKFKIIDKIEKQLRTNMFEDEWDILIREVGYKSNTDTEKEIISRFRIVIFVIIFLEVCYLLLLLYQSLTGMSLIPALFKLISINYCKC